MEKRLKHHKAKLVLPSTEFKNSYIEALKEFNEIDGDTIDVKEREKNFDTFLQKLKSDETTYTQDMVPNIQYWLTQENKYIGRGNYRPLLNEKLKFHGGNIGYAVRPSERGKGYALLILQKLLEKARDDGLTEVILTCDNNNIASVKTIEKAKGIFVGTDVDEDRILFNRYIIKL